MNDSTLLADLTLMYLGRLVTVKGDFEGHPFRGNQYDSGQGGNFGARVTESQAEHASLLAESASSIANARGNISNKKRSKLHDEAARLHRKAAEVHMGAAMGQSYLKQDYHHQIAAGHQSMADSHIQAAQIFREIKA